MYIYNFIHYFDQECLIVCAVHGTFQAGGPEIFCLFTHHHTKYLPPGKQEWDVASSLYRDIISMTFNISWCLELFFQSVLSKSYFQNQRKWWIHVPCVNYTKLILHYTYKYIFMLYTCIYSSFTLILVQSWTR